MAVVPTPGGRVDTRLFSAAWRLTYVADQFSHVGNTIKDVFLVGKWLSSPFIYISGRLWDVAQGMIDADRTIGDWLNWIRYIIDGNGFIQMLRWASWHFEQIRSNVAQWIKTVSLFIVWWFGWFLSDPTGWVNHFIRQISWVMGLLLDNPWNFLNHLLRGLRGWLGQFLDDPRGFVISLLSAIMPELWLFLINPLMFILGKIGQLIFDFNGFRFNPGNWILYRLSEYNGFLGELLRDPEGFIRRRVSRLFEYPDYFWSNPQFYLLENLIKKTRQYLRHFANSIKDIVVDFVLLFI